MSAVVLDAIARELALLKREVETPTGPLGYGLDLSCVSDVTPELAEVDPFSPVGIAEAVIRRLTTPRGGLVDDPDYGLDLRGYCNRGTTLDELRDLAGQCRSEVTKDDRIEEALFTITTPTRSELNVSARITPADPSLELFSFTFTIPASGAAMLEAIG
jgi:hypothetical protein